MKWSIEPYLEKIPKPILFGLGVLFFLAVVVLDFVTGPEVSASLFYLIPVVFFSWFFGKRWGLLACILSAFSWFISDALSGIDYLHPSVPYFNAFVRLGTFLVNSVIILKLREDLKNLKTAYAELKIAHEEIRRLTEK